jgi:4-amino-4-deoxy-L-arabinose transferase-like glycosyltransferase
MIECMEQRLNEAAKNPVYQYGMLAGVTLLAAALRFYKLGDWSFWIDEVFTLGHVGAHYSSLETIIENIPPSRRWVPVSLILNGASLNVFGTSEWSARIVSAIIGVITIPVFYFPVRRAFNISVALIAAVLLAISPWHLYWSQNARFYTTLLLFYFLASVAFYFAIENDRPLYIFIGFILFYLAVSERLFALFLGPVLISYLLLLKLLPVAKPPGLRMRNVILISLPVIAATLLNICNYVSSGDFVLGELSTYFFGAMNTTPVRLSASIAYRIGVPVLVLGGFAGFYLTIIGQRIGLFLLVSALLPALLLLVISTVAFTIDRYIFATLPFWIILAAVGVYTLFEQTSGQAKLLAVGVLVLFLAQYLGEDYLYFRFQNGNRPDWRAAFNVVEQQEQEGDLIFATRPELGSYYLGQDIQNLNWLDLAFLHSLDERAWFVVDEATSRPDPDIENWITQNSLLVDVFDVYLPGKSLSLRLYLYVPTEDG